MTTATGTTSSSASMAPERSLNQRMDALARANQIRIKRAQLKRDLKSGRLSIHALLLDPPEYVETAKVFDMLLAVPKYGRVKVNKILAHCRIAPSKTIGGLLFHDFLLPFEVTSILVLIAIMGAVVLASKPEAQGPPPARKEN